MILTGNQGPDTIQVVATTTRPAGHIPAGEVWEFDPNVSTTLTLTGNLVVEGVLRMRPASPDVEHVIRFEGIDESLFVGGGMDPVDSDVGLWVMGDGVLDIAGTHRERWNRTGTSETWLPGDELMIAPNEPGDYEFRPFTAGDKVPTVTAPDGTTVPTEVFNLTSNVRIEGTETGRAHIFIRGRQQQHIADLALRHMGPRVATKDGTEPVLGRYPIHFHHGEETQRGSTITSVVVRDSSRAFVPHGANGITFTDCLAYRITDDAYWWDLGHNSNDTLWDHCAAFDITRDPSWRGTTTGFFLGNGDNNEIRDCAAAVISGFATCSGAHWPEMRLAGEHSVWIASDLVCHNSRGNGVYVWQNDDHPHIVTGVTAYSNAANGLQHGAYGNRYEYENLLLFGNGQSDLRHQAIPSHGQTSGQRWTSVTAEHLDIAEHNKNKTARTTYPIVMTDLRCRRITVDENPPPNFGHGVYDLQAAPGWDLGPQDVTVRELYSTIHVTNADGTTFTVSPTTQGAH